MNFVAIVAALALEQWRAFQWRGAFQRAFVRYAHTLERRFNAGTAQQGAIAAVLALLPALALGTGIYLALATVHPLLALAWDVAILYLLAQRGVELSPSQVYRLVTEKPERLSMRTLLALLDILDCTMDDLVEPVAAAKPRRKAATAGDGPDAGVGGFRPKRARVTPEPR